jgi:cell division protein FtsW
MKLTAWFLHPWRFFGLVLAFSLFGLVLIYDVSVAESLQAFGNPWHFAARHAVWIAIGSAAFLVSSYLKPPWWQRAAPLLFLGVVGLLVAVLIPGIGQRVQGAQRWIVIGPAVLQPSEFAKLGVILFFSSWLDKHQRFAPFALLTGILFGLILLQPNLSTACIVVALATILYFIGGGSLKPLVGFGILGLALLAVLIIAVPYRRQRLTSFINPASDPLGKSYHIRQITIALGRGGLFGQGIGLSKQKQQYIPEAATDSIFAIYAEETGYAGASLLLFAYLFLINLGYTIAARQTSHYRFLLAAGITTWLTLHVVFNIAAMAALIPLTGVPLPLVSYGGSSYLSLMIGLGILAGLLRSGSPSAPGRRLLRRRK